MIIKPFTKENIAFVFACLWKRGREEAKTFNISLSELELNYHRMIGKPWTLAFYKNDQPCVLCYMEPIGVKRWRTNFVATEEGFQSIWISLTVFLKRISDSLAKDDGYLEMYADHNNDKAAEWFAVLGFRLDKTGEKVDKYIKTSHRTWRLNSEVMSYVRTRP